MASASATSPSRSAGSEDDDEFFEADQEWHDVTRGSSASPARSNQGGPGEEAAFFDAQRHLGSDSSYLDFPAHAAAFDGDPETLLACLGAMPESERTALDPQGNTVLHVATIKQHIRVVQALLDFGVSTTTQNSRGWLALDEAVTLKNRPLVELLYFSMIDRMKAQMKAKRHQLLDSMRSMPDHHMSLQWELGSPIFGFLLRKYAPHDTYQVWKRGTKVRVDGTLMGIDKESAGLIPQWKRGAFSLLFDGSTQPAKAVLLDRDKRTYIDVQKEKKAAKVDRAQEVNSLMTSGPGQAKVKTSDFHFKPAKTFFGNESTEKIAGWRTRVYEATGKLVAVTTKKASWDLPPDATFEDYLAMPPPQDRVKEVPIDPLSTNGLKMKGGSADSIDSESLSQEELDAQAALEAHAKKKGGRKITAKCWMAEAFPMSLSQLIPILDVIGYANKHLKKVGKFLRKYGDLQLFPVKLHVPIMMTVYLVMVNKSFRVLHSGDEAMQDDFYQIPDGFILKALKTDGMMGQGQPYDDGLDF